MHVTGSAPHVLVVGTPRSGTTLVQRLVAELDGVHTGPESHFLDRFLPRLLERRRFPLAGRELDVELARYLALPTSRGLPLDVDRLAGALGGEVQTPVELFGAVATALARRPAQAGGLVAEKTPEHLRWWRPLVRALPQLKVVGVVRDPRGVAASHLAVPWGVRPPLLAAEQWCIDVVQLAAAADALGARFHLVRYEEAAADPCTVRGRLAAFLGCETAASGRRGSEVVLGWEWWKQAAIGPVTPARVRAWTDRMSRDDALAVAARCREAMMQLGYRDVPGPEEAAAIRRGWPQALDDERRRFARAKARRQAVIDATELGPGARAA